MTNNVSQADARIIWPYIHIPKNSIVFAQNKVEIAASPDKVWTELINCLAWPSWYQYCSDVSIIRGYDTLTSDSQFRFKTLGMYFTPQIVTFETNKMLVWSATGPLGISGSHAWLIEETETGCRVTTEESQIGRLLYLLKWRIQGQLVHAHEDWLQSLKKRVEARK